VKRALVLTGLLREFKLTAPTIQKNLIEPFGISAKDIYVNVWSDLGYWVPGDGLNSTGFEASSPVTIQAVEEIYKTSNVSINHFSDEEKSIEAIGSQFHERFVSKLNHSNFLVRKKI
jgi:hypothetical protein